MIAPADDGVRLRVVEALADRFQIPTATFDDATFYQASGERVFLGPADLPGDVEPVTGATLCCRLHATVKPSTDFLQAFGNLVDKNVVVLDREQARAYLAGEDLPRGEVDDAEASRGWVHVRMVDGETLELGCGLLREEVLENVVPKGRRIDVRARP